MGGYGNGWNGSGSGIRVRQGQTIYVKFYSETGQNISLCFAEHGRGEGHWNSVGPEATDQIGNTATNPIILRITHAGTRQSMVTWTNGPGKSGGWAGPSAPGAYDLALDQHRKWTLPPIVVSEEKQPSFWQRFFGSPTPQTPSTGGVHAVSDAVQPLALLAGVLVLLGLLKRRLT